MPEIVSKLSRRAILRSCAVLLKSEQTPFLGQVVNIDLQICTVFDWKHVLLYSWANQWAWLWSATKYCNPLSVQSVFLKSSWKWLPHDQQRLKVGLKLETELVVKIYLLWNPWWNCVEFEFILDLFKLSRNWGKQINYFNAQAPGWLGNSNTTQEIMLILLKRLGGQENK